VRHVFDLPYLKTNSVVDVDDCVALYIGVLVLVVACTFVVLHSFSTDIFQANDTKKMT